MFGQRHKADQPINQIPYEVYQTAHEPDVRRRQWFIRLGVSLVVVTLMVLGGMQLQKLFSKDEPKTNNTSTNQADKTNPEGDSTKTADQNKPNTDNAATPGSVTQSPQQNAPLPASGSADSGVQPNTTSNNTAIPKPN